MPPILRLLHDHVFLEIFEYLDTFDLIKCSSVCRKWNQIISHYPSLWTQQMVIKGKNFDKADKMWSTLSKKIGNRKVKSLSLLIYDYYLYNVKNDTFYWGESELFETFPFESLLSFNYDGTFEHSEDIWIKSLPKCRKLKYLRWKLEGRRGQFNHNFKRNNEEMENLPLSKCNLEEFIFDCRCFPARCMVGNFTFLRQARKITIKDNLMPVATLRNLLQISKDTLEEVYLDLIILTERNLHKSKMEEYSINPIHMKKLHTFQASY